jgi:hypothetical protein
VDVAILIGKEANQVAPAAAIDLVRSGPASQLVIGGKTKQAVVATTTVEEIRVIRTPQRLSSVRANLECHKSAPSSHPHRQW